MTIARHPELAGLAAAITQPDSVTAPMPAANDVADTYETLMQFLYRAPIGLLQTAPSGAIEILNPASAQLLMPLSPDGNLDNLFTVLDTVAPELRYLMRDFTQPAGVVCDGVRVHLAGEIGKHAAQVLSISLMKLDEARLMAVVSDVTLEVEREQQNLHRGLSDAARTDSLTQMPNRAALREQVQMMMARASVDGALDFAVLFMNCDRFKQINDTLGQAAGDQVLSMMAERLRATLRQRDRGGMTPGSGQMVARIGSDEFVVILDGMRRVDDAHSVARRVLDVLAQPYRTRPHEITCNVSMGIVMAGDVVGDADSVLQDASIAMVEAKRGGGARYVLFETPMRERAEQRGGIEAELRRAIAQKELFVMYQPVVGFSEAGVLDRNAGVEALVRWRHPTRGIVPPLEFIGVAEECGLIGALGDFVLEAACRDFCGWQKTLGAAAPRLLAVNLSRAQLAQPGWSATVQRILLATGMPAHLLQLEITESLAAQDETIQQRLHELKSLGLQLALDDFGTGYSSLACLHLLPVDTVKIDRSFVNLADSSPHHQVLIEATVRVAHSLGMSTVAEGIETAAQSGIVRTLGCDKGQGYLFSRPLGDADLVRWMATDDKAPG